VINFIIWVFFLLSTQEALNQENKIVIIIDQNGSNTLRCCASSQGCHCSNLSLALENIKNDTEIKLMSDISLEYVIKFGNISNVTITGQDHTVQCNHQGGLVGENIIDIVIQGVTWDKCRGINFFDCTNASLMDCIFQNSMISSSSPHGGVICLINSTINVPQGLIKFYNNIADMGGAIFVDSSSIIYVNENATLEFINNSALYGGALYFMDTYQYPYNLPIRKDLILYYYNLLMRSNHFGSNIAGISGSYAYFDLFMDECFPQKSIKDKGLFSSSPCKMIIFDASIKANVSDYKTSLAAFNIAYSASVSFWLKDLQFSAIVVDFFNNYLSALNVTVACERPYREIDYNFYYTIDSIHNDLTLISESYIPTCIADPFKHTVTLTFLIYLSLSFTYQHDYDMPIKWQGQVDSCSDITHYGDPPECLLATCQNLDEGVFPPGFQCQRGNLVIIPGYWYNNGLRDYVMSCPPEYCNFIQWNYNIISQPFPDRNLQCNKNWMGFSCGECNHSDHSIIYGSTDCVSSHKCSKFSTPLSLLLLFASSFLYWWLVILFIFILLHFKFNINAGHAFSLIFYYSVLEQITSVLNQVTQLRYRALAEDIYQFAIADRFTQHYSSVILPFLSSIGTLKPPFTRYMKLCMGKAEMIDHVALVYIHPLIVFSIVVTMFVSARRFVFVARYIGRYVNSKSISLLVLLSYSSVSYTSVQILRPLAHFKIKHRFASFVGFRPYWSPNIEYFESRHMCYVIIAVLCEILIGFGFPFLLLFQRYLTRHHNINLMSIRPIIDQLQACYRNEYYWFSAYYLICRQVIYGVDIIGDVIFAIFMQKQQYAFAKFIILLLVCSCIILIHIWFQPHRTRSVNILDSAILLALLLLLISSLDGYSFRISVTLWILPLVVFINYLAYTTKAQHFVIFSSVCGLIILPYTFIIS